MSEIAKCPFCGSEMSETYLGYVCMNTSLENPCAFRVAKERISRMSAAMELARSTVKRKAAHDYVREAWKVSDEVSDLAREALEDADGEVKDATKRVLEVFGGE